MRIRNHISLLQMVAITGALGLAGMVGLIMSFVEATASELATTSELHKQLENLVVEGEAFRDLIDTLAPDLTRDSFVETSRSTERWLVELLVLRDSSPYLSRITMDQAIESLENMITQCRQLVSDSVSSELADADMAQFRDNAGRFVQGLNQLHRGVTGAVEAQDQSLSRRRRLGMVLIGVLGIIYLAAVEHTRHWTTRRLIRPMEDLAHAALNAVSAKELLPRLKDCGTKELNDVARMLSTYVDMLKNRVQSHTTELEHKTENLEHEVMIRRQAEEQLRYAAFHDQLTGLCNRKLLMDRISRCIERARRHENYAYAALYLDLDRFKEINDSLGHTAGDQLLIAIARRLQKGLRSTDTLSRVESNTIARIGGDEFVTLLDGIQDPSDAGLVAERLQKALADPFDLDGHEVFTTASIGIASNVIKYDSADSLLRDADAAMYHVKATGKARYEIFSERMHAEAMARLQLGNDLRRAIEKNEFLTYYQPIVSLKTGRLVGFETLVRWNHPQRGIVSPLEFIGNVEETGLIVRIGQWVLEQACKQLKLWHDEFDASLTISVNVSKRQVGDATLIHEVQRILESSGVPGQCLRLEITENVIMENPDSIAAVLSQLKQLGVQIHMDDFGTGYASLSCLHRFPIDVLKIDREFMRNMEQNKDYGDVVRTVVELAHNLKMDVIVEGVETQEQMTQLLALGTDYAQGYYLSKPLDADAAGTLIRSSPSWLQSTAA